ncbi:MAG: primosomal protein N' [Dialister sp.]|nr:primosomal protein N' [Dialister sp.]
MSCNLLCDVVINRPSKHLNHTFTYALPEALSYISPGHRVVVPFRRKQEEGIVLKVYPKGEGPLSFKPLPVTSAVDSYPWFTPEMIQTALWISSYYMCTLIEALRLFLIDKKGIQIRKSYVIHWEKIPASLDILNHVETSKVQITETEGTALFGKDALHTLVDKGFFEPVETVSSSYTKPIEAWLTLIKPLPESERKRRKKQAELSDYLAEYGDSPVSELMGKGFSREVITSLIKNGYACRAEIGKGTYSLVHKNQNSGVKTLTPEQNKAVSKINYAVDRDIYKGFLLFGVTGSGKTEVYLRAAENALSHDKCVLILVPEIAMTNQMTAYFAKRFGEEVVFFHSNLSKGERYNNRARVQNGESRIVIGSRSSLFLPFNNLGLIIVDEEYDYSYKQSDGPRYNGRDVAKIMAGIYHCPIVLGAATPSIATYYSAEQGKMDLLPIQKRVHDTLLPEVRIVDLKREPLGNSVTFSRAMIDLIRQTIRKKEKVILLYNRRGYATTLLCQQCGYIFKCPHCDVSLVYHKDKHCLSCHYCDTVFPLPKRCPKCGDAHILYLGRGTQKVEEELRQAIPNVTYRRFDQDSTQRKYSAQSILTSFRKGQFDVLLGTQMVAKGHDIPGVQTVGILSVDSTLSMPTYLAGEQAFNLIAQCAGRAGRGKKQGEVILQTYNPDHYVIRSAAKQDYISFYKQELAYRRTLSYPPFTQMMKITSFNKNKKTAEAKAFRIYEWISDSIRHGKNHIFVTAPFDEAISKIRNVYQISILIKGDTLSGLKHQMRTASLFKENDIIIDVDPI